MTTDQVMALIQQEITSVIEGLNPAFTPAPEVAFGWPTEKFLQDVARVGGAGIAIYDRGISRKTTRWMPFPAMETAGASSILVALSGSFLLAGRTQTITLSGGVSINDGVGLRAAIGGAVSGATAVAGSTDTLDTMATALAAAINANATLAAWMSASASGAVVTLTGISAIPITLSVAKGNITTQLVEYGRINRQLQLLIWTRTQADRETLAEAILSDFARVEAQFGFVGADGTWARICVAGDVFFDKDVLKDLYRRDILIDTEYGLLTSQTAYQVLVTEPTLTVVPAGQAINPGVN